MHEEELLAEDARGRDLLHLRREKEQLRDTVWLAGAPPPLQALWAKVGELLGEAPTTLQQAALSHAPLAGA